MTKIKTVPWKRGLKFKDMAVGTVVTGVPLSHEMFKVAFARVLKRCQDNWHFWQRVNELMQYDQVLPIYYCLKCKQTEDGKHRLLAARVLDMKKIDIVLWPRCYKDNRERMQSFENRMISGEIGL